MARLYKLPDWPSLRATLFGKFYKAIVANYLAYVRGYRVYDANKTIRVERLKLPPRMKLWKRLEPPCSQGLVDHETIRRLLDKLEASMRELEDKRKRGKIRRLNPDPAGQEERQPPTWSRCKPGQYGSKEDTTSKALHGEPY